MPRIQTNSAGPDTSAKRTDENLFRLADGTLLAPFIGSILHQRGIIGQGAMRSFLEPKLQDLPSPFLMKDMQQAVKIIERAISENQEILIWGDYDVDGTTATALLFTFFQALGHKSIRFHIPNRLTEGYGLNRKSLLELSKVTKSKNRVLITVDNGISAFDEVLFAQELGYITIVTDHHTPSQARVSADAVLNVKQQDCNFPDKDLSGVGMAFYLAMGIRSHLGQRNFFKDSKGIPNLKSLLDLVAIGTIADMVPLLGINRLLVKAGMETIAQGTNHGLTALCRQTNIDSNRIRSEDISFQLAPKINAVGRLGNAKKAVELFLSNTRKEATVLANELVEDNKRRRHISLKEYQKAQKQRIKSGQEDDSSIVVAGGYHVGVAGIVAANLTEEFGKPTVILCECEGDLLKGSARSVPGVNLYQALEECSEVLLTYGGHEMAGGMALEAKKLPVFKKLFDDAVFKQTQGQSYKKSIEADCDLEIAELFTGNMLDQLYLLEPFGEGNPQLNFRDLDARIERISAIGDGKEHLRFSFINGKSRINGVGFGLGNKIKEYRGKGVKEILYTPTINFFKGRSKWEVRVSKVEVVGK
ncbi:MAG: single-stranded-DNA-specific exonuclease RecJ [Proteobacteria bacterium]|nr:single-stranded-DNA-specific exonuclease RecJ [Pseudomonadota bacterium]MBU1417085.1 single-stranded-DNA-specific exonuclease RecJ [Pseudomonadota bacterium]MBU1453781.1 single-stranded-DNA-specific exonuclease RecJ [Pseudomonadota bacterium]